MENIYISPTIMTISLPSDSMLGPSSPLPPALELHRYGNHFNWYGDHFNFYDLVDFV